MSHKCIIHVNPNLEQPPNFSKIFIIHIDTSKMQLGGVISQNGKPIVFYSQKLTPAQITDMNTE